MSAELLASALQLPEHSIPAALNSLSLTLEANPLEIISLYPALIGIINSSNSIVVVRFLAAQIQSALESVKVTNDMKSAVAESTLSVVSNLLFRKQLDLKKVGIQILAILYPFLFKLACNNQLDAISWEQVVAFKEIIIEIWKDESAKSIGLKVTATKLVQRIIQTQTRGTADPRLQKTAEPNIGMCRANHVFLKIGQLETEANALLGECITFLFTTKEPNYFSGLINSLTSLLKMRPTFAQLVITALCNWTPVALAGSTFAQIKSAEKTVKLALTHLLKTSYANAFTATINSFLNQQALRIEQSTIDQTLKALSNPINNKRPSTSQAGAPTKKFKTEEIFVNGNKDLAGFDATTLPVHLVVELIIASLQILEVGRLEGEIQKSRSKLERNELPAPAPIEEMKPVASIDPLNFGMEDDEEMKPEFPKVEEPEVEEPEPEEDDQLITDSEIVSAMTARVLTEEDTIEILKSTMERLCAAGMEGTGTIVWTRLISRLITRGMKTDYHFNNVPLDEETEAIYEVRREALRGVLFDFVCADLGSRMEFARLWLNEEWFVDSVSDSNRERPYDRWLGKLLEHILSYSSNKDKSFSQFMVDLPQIPTEEIKRLGEMCKNPEQLQLGFSALRDLALLRPPARQGALDVLLGLTTSSDKLTRNAAIMTVKQWVPEFKPLSEKVVDFALSLLKKLETPLVIKEEVVKAEVAEDEMEIDEKPVEAVVILQSRVVEGVLVDGLPTPSVLSGVVQHIELFFSLCTKRPNLLDHLFTAYASFPPFIQQSLQTLITPMIRSLGTTNPKIPNLIENFPAGSEPLVLRILAILGDKGIAPPALVGILKRVILERDVGNEKMFIIVLPVSNKSEIIQFIPKILTCLNNTPAEKLIVRSMFETILLPSASSFGGSLGGSVSRMRQADLLTPVELMVLLHGKEMNLKNAIEGIGICFSMADTFRPEILATFMQLVLDEAILPVLFMRTVIQAITTYKSLQPFVSTTLLSRLIAKQVWSTPALWEGFIRVSKLIAPHSFSALLQLPTEQLISLLTKQPTLKEPLREFVMSKSGGNNSGKIDNLLSILDSVVPAIVA